jgi:hypothetical protein
MSFDCFFSPKDIDYEVWIEDDDRVCYAYVFNAEGKICGNVWLYNRVPAPQWFEDARGVPPRNPAPFVATTEFSLPRSSDEFTAQWYEHRDLHYARILIRNKLAAIVAPGARPGWSVLAKEDGPFAKALRPSSKTNLDTIDRHLRALKAAETDSDPGEATASELNRVSQGDGDVIYEMTATDHRGRENFKKNHPDPERRISKAVRRWVRTENRNAWMQDWREGRFDGLPRLAPEKKIRPRRHTRARRELSNSATLDEVLQAIADDLDGVTATESDIRLLRSRLPAALVPDWLVDVLERYKLAGTDFRLTEEQDLSGLGADVMWLSAKHMVGEACDLEPGVTIVRSGFLPFGGCGAGSGDPFFFDLRNGSNNPPVVRVPHDYAGGESYPLDAIELVAPSLTTFLKTAEIG